MAIVKNPKLYGIPQVVVQQINEEKQEVVFIPKPLPEEDGKTIKEIVKEIVVQIKEEIADDVKQINEEQQDEIVKPIEQVEIVKEPQKRTRKSKKV